MGEVMNDGMVILTIHCQTCILIKDVLWGVMRRAV